MKADNVAAFKNKLPSSAEEGMPGQRPRRGWLVCRVRLRRIEPPRQQRAAPWCLFSVQNPPKSPVQDLFFIERCDVARHEKLPGNRFAIVRFQFAGVAKSNRGLKFAVVCFFATCEWYNKSNSEIIVGSDSRKHPLVDGLEAVRLSEPSVPSSPSQPMTRTGLLRQADWRKAPAAEPYCVVPLCQTPRRVGGTQQAA